MRAKGSDTSRSDDGNACFLHFLVSDCFSGGWTAILQETDRWCNIRVGEIGGMWRIGRLRHNGWTAESCRADRFNPAVILGGMKKGISTPVMKLPWGKGGKQKPQGSVSRVRIGRPDPADIVEVRKSG